MANFGKSPIRKWFLRIAGYMVPLFQSLPPLGVWTGLMTMPISPWRDFVGRILALLAFSSLSAISVVLVGFVCGARFSYTMLTFWQVFGFILLIFIASAGIGMLIATFIKNVQGAIMTGVELTVVSAAISGVMTPYISSIGASIFC